MEEIVLIWREAVSRTGDREPAWKSQRVVGVLDDDSESLDTTSWGVPVVGNSFGLSRLHGGEVCVSSMSSRSAWWRTLNLPNGATVIDQLRNPADCPISASSILLANVTITIDAT
jgi:hypothetical protein